MTSPRIDRYRFGEIVVDGRVYQKDVIIFPAGVRPEWWRMRGHSLAMQDLEEVMSDPPRVLIVGSGAHGRMQIPEETRREIEAAGVQVVAQTTAKAIETYNRIRQEGGVVAALHLTC